mgnify:CR=1 FL=1
MHIAGTAAALSISVVKHSSEVESIQWRSSTTNRIGRRRAPCRIELAQHLEGSRLDGRGGARRAPPRRPGCRTGGSRYGHSAGRPRSPPPGGPLGSSPRSRRGRRHRRSEVRPQDVHDRDVRDGGGVGLTAALPRYVTRCSGSPKSRSRNSWSRRDFPIPASPSRPTTWPWPRRASSSRLHRRPSSGRGPRTSRARRVLPGPPLGRRPAGARAPPRSAVARRATSKWRASDAAAASSTRIAPGSASPRSVSSAVHASRLRSRSIWAPVREVPTSTQRTAIPERTPIVAPHRYWRAPRALCAAVAASGRPLRRVLDRLHAEGRTMPVGLISSIRPPKVWIFSARSRSRGSG